MNNSEYAPSQLIHFIERNSNNLHPPGKFSISWMVPLTVLCVHFSLHMVNILCEYLLSDCLLLYF